MRFADSNREVCRQRYQEQEKENECPTIPLDSGACGTIGNEQPIINYFRAVFPRIAPHVAILLIPRELLT